MRKKGIYKFIIALLLVCSFMIPNQFAYCEEITLYDSSKIEQELQDKLSKNNNAYTVWIWVEEPDLETIYSQVEGITGTREAFTGTNSEWEELYEYWFNYYANPIYEKYSKTIQKELGISELNAIPGYRVEPVIGARLSKDDIYRIAQNEKVTAICCYNSDDVTNPEKYNVFTYTPEHALNILQVCVGLKSGYLPNWEYDVNRDQKITINDALWALQSSVKLYTIAWPWGMLISE